MKTFLIVALLAAAAFAAPNALGTKAGEDESLLEVNREKKSPTFTKVKTFGHAVPQSGFLAAPIAPPVFVKQVHVYREDENNDSSEEEAPRKCTTKIVEPKTNETCKETSEQNEDGAQIDLTEDQIRRSIAGAMETINKLTTRLEQIQGQMDAKQNAKAQSVQEAQPSQGNQPEQVKQPATETQAVAEEKQSPDQAAEESKAGKETGPTQEATSARMQWKDAEDAADQTLMTNIATAKQALDDAQRMFNEMLTMNREASPASERTQNFAKMSENERIAHWKNAIENIERNVEIANDIKKSFSPEIDNEEPELDDAVPAASELKVHVVKPESMPSHTEEKSAMLIDGNEPSMRNTNIEGAEEILKTEEVPFARGHEHMHIHHPNHHHHHHHLRQPESESLLPQNMARNDNQNEQSQLMMTAIEDNQNERSDMQNMQMLPRPVGMSVNFNENGNMERQRQMFRMNPERPEDLQHHMRASPMSDARRIDSEMQAENLESVRVDGQSRRQQMRIPLSRSMHWRPSHASDEPRSAYGPGAGALSLNIAAPAPLSHRRPQFAIRPNFAQAAPGYGAGAAPIISANSNFAAAHSFLADEESGAGESVGVFPSAGGGCSVPLLLSCSPSVVQGSLAHPAPAPLAALQAPHHAPAAYGGPAVTVNAGGSFAGPAYRDGEQSSLHTKRDVKVDVTDKQPEAVSNATVPEVKINPQPKNE